MKWSLGLWSAIFVLLVSTAADAAFYFVRDGQLARFGPEIRYRFEDPKAPLSFDEISSTTAGWISQRDRPFAGTRDPVSLWIRFDLPTNISARRLFLSVPLW